MLGARHRGLAKLAEYLKANKFEPVKPTKHKWTTKQNGSGGVEIPDLYSWSDYDLDILALNNLMAALRVKQMQNDNWKPKKADFTDYVDRVMGTFI
jgi:hypothetical protein